MKPLLKTPFLTAQTLNKKMKISAISALVLMLVGCPENKKEANSIVAGAGEFENEQILVTAQGKRIPGVLVLRTVRYTGLNGVEDSENTFRSISRATGGRAVVEGEPFVGDTFFDAYSEIGSDGIKVQRGSAATLPKPIRELSESLSVEITIPEKYALTYDGDAIPAYSSIEPIPTSELTTRGLSAKTFYRLTEIELTHNASLDSDGDFIKDSADNCPSVSNFTQHDVDQDGIGDSCDAFPRDKTNPVFVDSDNDTIADSLDNCPNNANIDQADSDLDSVGDACDAIEEKLLALVTDRSVNAASDYLQIHTIGPFTNVVQTRDDVAGTQASRIETLRVVSEPKREFIYLRNPRATGITVLRHVDNSLSGVIGADQPMFNDFAVTPDGKYLIATINFGAKAIIYDLNPNSANYRGVVSEVTLDTSASNNDASGKIAISSDSRIAYITFNNSVNKVDIDPQSTGFGNVEMVYRHTLATSIAISPDDARLFVAYRFNFGGNISHLIGVLDTTTRDENNAFLRTDTLSVSAKNFRSVPLIKVSERLRQVLVASWDNDFCEQCSKLQRFRFQPGYLGFSEIGEPIKLDTYLYDMALSKDETELYTASAIRQPITPTSTQSRQVGEIQKIDIQSGNVLERFPLSANQFVLGVNTDTPSISYAERHNAFVDRDFDGILDSVDVKPTMPLDCSNVAGECVNNTFSDTANQGVTIGEVVTLDTNTVDLTIRDILPNPSQGIEITTRLKDENATDEAKAVDFRFPEIGYETTLDNVFESQLIFRAITPASYTLRRTNSGLVDITSGNVSMISENLGLTANFSAGDSIHVSEAGPNDITLDIIDGNSPTFTLAGFELVSVRAGGPSELRLFKTEGEAVPTLEILNGDLIVSLGDNISQLNAGDTVILDPLNIQVSNNGVPVSPTEFTDFDNDGLLNGIDEDDDNDGVIDENDAFPLDSTESADTDGDDIGDNSDAFPNDATETVDSDGDGVGDNSDAFPNNANESADSDGDGVGDNSDAFPNNANETVDTDGDGVGDNNDAFPNDATESADSDGDGVGDNSDAFPNNANETVDSDGDGVGDNSDAFPNNANESADSDGDGVGDNSDAFPNNANETVDTDGDGVGDNSDAFPNDANESADSDGDGYGDNADVCLNSNMDAIAEINGSPLRSNRLTVSNPINTLGCSLSDELQKVADSYYGVNGKVFVRSVRQISNQFEQEALITRQERNVINNKAQRLAFQRRYTFHRWYYWLKHWITY